MEINEELKQKINSLNINDLIDFIKANMKNKQFSFTWKYILQCFFENDKFKHNRLNIIDAILTQLQKDTNNTNENVIINQLCMQIKQFDNEELVNLCELCLKYIQSQNVVKTSWKDLLPELLNTLLEIEKVEFNNIEMTGLEYKNQFINSLCLIFWPEEIIINLTSMFKDMPLTKEEHLKILLKLCKYLDKVKVQEIPSFVYQLLKFCKYHNGIIIFLTLQNFFGKEIYDHNLLFNIYESSSLVSSDLGIIEKANATELIEVEANILYHIHSLAFLGNNSIKDYLLFLKNLLRLPEIVLHPFQISVLLTLSTIPNYEEKCFDIIRSSITRAFNEEQKKTNSAWFTDIITTKIKVELIFVQIINLNVEERELFLQGLVNFGIFLLGIGSPLGRDLIAEKQWHLGTMILYKIIKKKSNILPVILKTLSNRIITGSNIIQYIECLYLLINNKPLLLLDNKNSIIELLECLMQISVTASDQLLDALFPIIKLSSMVRDHVILLLRKALYSRIIETRQMAVFGFLKLLSNLNISNLSSLNENSFSSGSFSSGRSIITQISLNNSKNSQFVSGSISNEALCLEILTILKRCFTQQAEIKIQLYDGLYKVICLNSGLALPILDMIWSHINEFYIIDKNTCPPLKLNEIVLIKGDSQVTLKEPLGKLIYLMGLIITNINMSNNDDNIIIIKKFKTIMDSICQRMINCEIIHLELDDGSNLIEITKESQQKIIILKETISIYEYLIAYKINLWESESSEEISEEINNLFQAYNKFKYFFKNINKTKKKNEKPVKKNNSQTKFCNQFALPETILDYSIIERSLKILYEPDFIPNSKTSSIRCNKEFHQFIIQATINIIISLKNKKLINTKTNKEIFNHILNITALLYKNIIKTFKKFIDFDLTTAIMVIECFHNILNIVFVQFKNNSKLFLNEIVNSKEKHFDQILKEIIEVFQNLFETDEEDFNESPELKKMSLIFINILIILYNQLTNEDTLLINDMMNWLKKIAINQKFSSKQVASNFINLLFDFHIKFKVSLTFLECVAIKLGDITGVINTKENDEEKKNEENIEVFNFIDDNTVHNVFLCLCNTVKIILDDIDWIISKLKAEHHMIICPGEENAEKNKENIQIKERGICCQLCFVVNILTNISNCTIPPGTLSEAVLKDLSLFYCTMGNLTKYFLMRSSKINPIFQNARFERLVKLSGKQLAPAVYKLILYIDKSQNPNSNSTESQMKKKTKDSSTLKNKVLKETRLIPKVIYEIEQFSRIVIQLSNKTKIDLTHYVGQGVSRDFRIIHLKEVLEEGGVNNNDISNTTSQNSDMDCDDEIEEKTPSSPPCKKAKI